MKNELLFELNDLIVNLENNNRFSEAAILNEEFVKLAQLQGFQKDVDQQNYYNMFVIRMLTEMFMALDDISVLLKKNTSLGMLKSVASAIKTLSKAIKNLNNPQFVKKVAQGLKSIPKNVLMNKNLLSTLKTIPGVAFQFIQLYFLVIQILNLVKKTNSETFNDANSRSIFFGEFLGFLSTLVSIAAPLLGPAAPGLHALALSLQGTGLLLEYAPEAAGKIMNYLENVTPEVEETVALGERGIPTCKNMTYEWANDKVLKFTSDKEKLFNELNDKYRAEIKKPGPHTQLISSIIKNPEYKNINQQYIAEMIAIIKCFGERF